MIGGVIFSSIYSLIALGLNIIWGTMKLVNVAHGELIMIGAYITYWLFSLFAVTPLIGIPLSALIIGASAIPLYKWLFKRLIFRIEQTESVSLLIFFSISIILQNAAS